MKWLAQLVGVALVARKSPGMARGGWEAGAGELALAKRERVKA